MQDDRQNMFTRILEVVARVPSGKVATYGDIAYAAGFPGAARQVAWALHKSQRLPWQRIVGAEGKILLPADQGLEQRLRLQQEGVTFVGSRVNLKRHRATLTELKRSRPAKTKNAPRSL